MIVGLVVYICCVFYWGCVGSDFGKWRGRGDLMAATNNQMLLTRFTDTVKFTVGVIVVADIWLENLLVLVLLCPKQTH